MKKFKTHVKYLDAHTIYRTTQKQVICTLSFAIDLYDVPCIGALWHDDRFNKMIASYKKKFLNPDDKFPVLIIQVYGCADCTDNDVFDKELGRKLALTRAQKNAFIFARDFYGYCSYLVQSQVDELDRLSENCNISVNRCKSHIFNDLLK